MQLVYPDRNGFLPDEPGFDHRLRYAQPVLDAAAEAPGGAGVPKRELDL